ncbi:hypothetical protein Thpro_021567 [Acidihalobacter prosperus]|uniref:Uncharacterized protein n=1 Tax=Acidihalobacter prosperus TaxID=160660 RepID=A0A1A6C3V6_9GAMM|nr:hypothetical protein Thpro_021567 [Acidihalobacter prosperus]
MARRTRHAELPSKCGHGMRFLRADHRSATDHEGRDQLAS